MAKVSKSGAGGKGDGNFFSQVGSQTWLMLGVAVLSVWFVLANTASASIRFWIPTVEAPMWIVLIGTFAAGAFTGWMVKTRNTR
ncbi:lipopolysaccharide assembly protein LapA domain-containing protein [Yinghuangia soli]|uniref:LapA family protein n=1 Tax=Yinghuangia soli TaxID=2908204 RepID=A0AA41Q756_9ACTN|nr:LapA family protein [Yinghuangia soli]MCF2531951.1 LapA family protein [Yinghuangia soli]